MPTLFATFINYANTHSLNFYLITGFFWGGGGGGYWVEEGKIILVRL